jgi:toxin-antitoxin system PIN domain toxin
LSLAIDVNILLYASNTESPFHAQAKHFLTRCAAGPDIVCLGWTTVMSYLRIATHPGIFAKPLSPQEAMANIEALLALRHVRVLAEEEGFWAHFRAVTSEVRPRGNLVPDIHLAALLRQHGIPVICTHDRDYRKFDFLKVVDPIKA